MSRKSRRKTLSHLEIENFLCDITEPEVLKTEPNLTQNPDAPRVEVVWDLKGAVRDLYQV
jgi:hypothetical protein